MVRNLFLRRPGWMAAPALLGVVVTFGVLAWAADSSTEYPGTVVMVDASAGKLVVKKDGGGSRFTFTVNDKTQFEGGIKSLKDIKQGTPVTVKYVVEGSQYMALKITAKTK